MIWRKRYHSVGNYWVLSDKSNYTNFRLVKMDGTRYIESSGVKKQITKEQFHYFHQHPDEFYMEQML